MCIRDRYKDEESNSSTLESFLLFIMNTLQSSVQEGKALEFDACLYCLGVLKRTIADLPQATTYLESLITSFVLPGLANSVGLVKAVSYTHLTLPTIYSV
eukprot:TRINITY_DN22827_c0_g1_i1.p1 TRINITY_DN22827_c0_g1~~TRINITY_DN22827_c0_g1_i1.p1  ORF type:complete len:100 (+),score=17.41 TRINITY_DN22827_c0_g1_i1:75-374(+)